MALKVALALKVAAMDEVDNPPVRVWRSAASGRWYAQRMCDRCGMSLVAEVVDFPAHFSIWYLAGLMNFSASRWHHLEQPHLSDVGGISELTITPLPR